MPKWLVRIIVYFLGVSFYESSTKPANGEVIRSEFRTIDDKNISFLFYREVFKDTSYRLGKFRDLKIQSFVIHAKMDSEVEGHIATFNNRMYLFKGAWLSWVNDQDLADILLEIYMDFMKSKKH